MFGLVSEIFSLITTCWVALPLLALGAAAVAAKIAFDNKTQRLREKWSSVGEDVVILHGFSRARTTPCVSPFVLKLETYLRMAKIKYEYDSEKWSGPKDKAPWITLNGRDLADSELIMEMLSDKFDVKLGDHLSAEQRATAKAMQSMTDEHLFWCFVWWRLYADPENLILSQMDAPLLLRALLKCGKPYIKFILYAQGIGRHKNEEIIEMARKVFEAISLYLGDKKYLMGDKPCQADCSVFGFMANGIWSLTNSPYQPTIQKLPNLIQYCERIKAEFYPDWDQLLLK